MVKYCLTLICTDIFQAGSVRADKLVTEDVVPKTYQHSTKDQDDVSHSNFVLHSIRELKSVIYDWSPYRCFVLNNIIQCA